MPQLVVIFQVGKRVVVVLLQVLHVEVGSPHTQRLEDSFPDNLLPALPGELLRQESGRQEHEVVVLPGFPQLLVGSR